MEISVDSPKSKSVATLTALLEEESLRVSGGEGGSFVFDDGEGSSKVPATLEMIGDVMIVRCVQ